MPNLVLSILLGRARGRLLLSQEIVRVKKCELSGVFALVWPAISVPLGQKKLLGSNLPFRWLQEIRKTLGRILRGSVQYREPWAKIRESSQYPDGVCSAVRPADQGPAIRGAAGAKNVAVGKAERAG